MKSKICSNCAWDCAGGCLIEKAPKLREVEGKELGEVVEEVAESDVPEWLGAELKLKDLTIRAYYQSLKKTLDEKRRSVVE